MLRNSSLNSISLKCSILNEVLSLNAQESVWAEQSVACVLVLNEVLSLNAQE